MKIAHLVPTLHPGGPEIGLVDLAGAAREVGMELVVIAISSTSDTSQVSALQELGVPVAELGLPPWDPRTVPRTARLLRARKVQLVHTHLPAADVVGAAAAVRNRIPAVSTLHRIENLPADRMDRLKRTVKILARQRFMARTIAISQVQREWYRGLAGFARRWPVTGPGRILVVPNGVADPGPVADADAERERCRAALGVGDGAVLAVSTAPMRRDQGHELLLDALDVLPDGGSARRRPRRRRAVAPVAGGSRRRQRRPCPTGAVRPPPSRPGRAARRQRPGPPHRPLRCCSDGTVAGDGSWGARRRHPGRRRPGDRRTRQWRPRPAHCRPHLRRAGGAHPRRPTAEAAGRGSAGARERFVAEFDAEAWARRLLAVYESVLA